MSDQHDNAESLFASTQSMGAFGSLPISDVGPLSEIEPEEEDLDDEVDEDRDEDLDEEQ